MKPMLAKALEREVAEWERKQYAELAALEYPIIYERGINGDPSWNEVEVELLEKNERYIQVSVAVDDGGLGAFCPPSYSVVVRAPET